MSSILCAVLLLMLAASVPDDARAQTPFVADGFAGDHPLHSLMPNEHVDPLSGNLLVTATDLSLPGPIPLAVTRIYSSQVFPDFENGQSTALGDDSWAGIGWSLHWGRILHADNTGPGQTIVDLPGGGGGPLYRTSKYPEGWMTKGFARYNRSTRQLLLPNGLTYTFDHSTTTPRGGLVRYVTEIRDVYGNKIEFEYFSSSGPQDGVKRIRQYVTPTQYREVTFTYDATLKSLATMKYGGETWTYTQQASGSSGYSLLKSVRYPLIWREWIYTYASGYTGEMTKIQTPGMGVIEYTYDTKTRYAASTTRPARVVVQRLIRGHMIDDATWTFSYSGGSNKDETAVVSPCGTTRYRFNGIGLNGDFSAWLSGTLSQRTVEQGGTVLETETRTYARSEMISSDSVPGQGSLWSDGAVYGALLNVTTTTRQGHTWTADHDYLWGQGDFNHYLIPFRTTWDGDRRKVETRTFATGITPHILGLVRELEITVGQERVYLTWTYEGTTGFTTSKQVGGIRTDYERNSRGQVLRETDERGNSTTYSYDWGVVSRIQTPHLTADRTINQDGNVTSERVGTLETLYTYDELGRLLSADPPGATTAPVTYSYHYTTHYYQILHDGTLTHVNVDGFGRPWYVEAGGIKVERQYDGCGRVKFESVPYTTGDRTRGTRWTYDALGRVLTETASDGSVVTTSYQNGNDVRRTDPLGRATTYRYSSGGHPDGGVLTAVVDPANVTTTYSYDPYDNLTKVNQPGVPLRQWIIDASGLLLEDRQPETGSTFYQHDDAGNLTRVTNANGDIVTFTYDGNNRLVGRQAPDANIAITYNSLGQVVSKASSHVTTTFSYDDAGRVRTRTDSHGALTWTSTYGYDARSNVTSITYPSGRLVTYEYDALNRITAVRMNGALFASGFTYDDAGRLTSWTTGGVTHTRQYDVRNRVTTARSVAGGAGLDLTYGYNTAGQVLSIADARPGMSQSFSYDVLDRLTTANGPWGRVDWAYDSAGNRLWERRGALTTFSYDSTTQRLTGTSGATSESFVYDNAGRLKQDGRAGFIYTPVGLLRYAQSIPGGAVAAYQYDADDLRLARSVNDITAYTVRDAGGRILSEYQQACAGTAWARDLIYAGGMLIGAARAVSLQPTIAIDPPSPGTVTESLTSTTVTVRLTTSGGPSACGVTAAWETRAGTAAAGADFVATAGTIVFPAGAANGATQQIPITLLPDNWDEDDETFVVALANPVGALLGASPSATITIVDDDPTPALSMSSIAVSEPDSGATSATLTVTLSNPSGREVTASFTTADGTATAGTDYVAESGAITFAPGTTSQQISVSVLGDLATEADETFTVALTNVQHADPPAGPATVTIIDNDRMEVTLVANRSFPMAAGQSVTFTATASKGTPPYEYLFRLTQHSTGTTRRVQGYFQTQTFTWTPATPGTYTLTVWARTVGSTVDYEAARSIAVTITEAPPISVTSLTPNNPGPVEGGTTVVWTATATGGVPPLQYQFRAYNSTTGIWEVVRDYAPSPTVGWAPLRAGTYTMEVRVRRSGSMAAYEATRQYTGYGVYMNGMSPVSLTANQVFPVAPGTPVTWTFMCASGTPPPYFQFMVRPTSSSTWSVGQAYSTSNTWTWTPTTPNSYAIQGWGKETWFPGQYLTYINGPTATVASGPVSSVGLTASQSVPLTVGQTISWAASATGGNAPLEYRYWLHDYTAGTWTVVRDFSPARSWAWTPPTFGQYAIQVWVRPQGSTSNYESYAVFGPFTVAP